MPALPEQFYELERFVPEWVVDSEADRYRFRVSRTIEELDSFYAAVFPRLDDLANYIDQYPLDAMPREAVLLLRLGQMLMEISPAVGVYRQPDVPNSTPFERFTVISPLEPIHIADGLENR
ncbi:MAG: hypothetical protein HKP27_01790 [Myxococcales bacterium]|nr:hypothetical protein [Myxococcales bacterium]